ncbi:MAG: uroporphyrinogen-III synthase [Nitrospiraceae bacterium]
MSQDQPAEGTSFRGLRVAAFESRMAESMANLIRRYGGEPLVTPALREIPLSDHHSAFEFGERLFAGQIDMLLLLTGVGTQVLVEALATRHPIESIIRALAHTTLVARGPKPVAVLKRLGLTPSLIVPEPNTWRDLLAALDEQGSLANRRVAIQEYGAPNQELVHGLVEREAKVMPVSVYKWALPEDTTQLSNLLIDMIAGTIDVLLVTNAAQVDHVMRVLERGGNVDAMRAALKRMVVASIGPTASERMRNHGWPVDLEPSHPKMGILVKEVSEAAHSLLRRRRTG